MLSLFMGLLFTLPSVLSSQEIVEESRSMSLGVQNAMYVEIQDANRKLSENIWKNYIKDYGKTKNNKKAKEWYTQTVRVPSISTDQEVDIYTKFEEMGSMTRVYFWVDMGDGFLNSEEYGSEATGTELFIKDYALEVRKESIRKELEEQEKKLEKHEKDMGKLVKNNEKYHKEIEDARKKIREKEEDIVKNLEEQEKKKSEIDAQRAVVDEILNRLNSLRRI